MLADLDSALSGASRTADRAAYAATIIDANCLAKPTASTRRISNQRLGELYALDPRCPIFRVLRHLWWLEEHGRPLLGMLAALARDPLFAASAPPILSLAEGAELQRAPTREALRDTVGERMNSDVLDKVLRNAASSWTQTGHLEGRTFKVRRRVHASPATLAFALYLAHVAGFRGDALLTSGWVVALDCSPSSARALAQEAKRLGLLDLRTAENVAEFGFQRLDPGAART